MGNEYSFYTVGPVARSAAHPRHAVIVPELVVGEYPRPEDVPWLRDELEVSGVLCLQDAMDLDRKALTLLELERSYLEAGIAFCHAPVPDGEVALFSKRLPEILRQLAALLVVHRRVYVHCNAGMNRAPTVVVAYLHVHGGLTLAAARDLVKERHPCVPYMTMLEALYPPAPSDSDQSRSRGPAPGR